MQTIQDPNQYKLLTPGPLTTSLTVREAMLQDWCTWDDDYNQVIQKLRQDLVELATKDTKDYTAVLMQGSGTFAVESVLGSAISSAGKALIMTNGAYGERMCDIARVLKIPYAQLRHKETEALRLDKLQELLEKDSEITHVAMVHCETTTGILNSLESVSKIVKSHQKVFIVDAMSSFGGIPMDVAELQIDFLISSANKCIQGVPGFGFVIAQKDHLNSCKGQARSLSLDLYDQWYTMEKNHGKWRYTSPTHVVKAFCQALEELKAEGGVGARHKRYHVNQRKLVLGMREIGFEPLLDGAYHSPIITSFLYPQDSAFTFQKLYNGLKAYGYVIYPGKISQTDTFRIGNIGEVYPKDIDDLLCKVQIVYQNILSEAHNE